MGTFKIENIRIIIIKDSNFSKCLKPEYISQIQISQIFPKCARRFPGTSNLNPLLPLSAASIPQDPHPPPLAIGMGLSERRGPE